MWEHRGGGGGGAALMQLRVRAGFPEEVLSRLSLATSVFHGVTTPGSQGLLWALPGASCLTGPSSPPGAGAAWLAGIPTFAVSCPLPLPTLPARPCGEEDYFNQGRMRGKSAMRKGGRLLALPSAGALATCPSTLVLMDMDFMCPA